MNLKVTQPEGKQCLCLNGQLTANCPTVLNNIAGSSQNTSDKPSDSNEKGKTYTYDPTKPVGEACNENGTLRETSELEWPDSPTEPNAFEFHGVDSNMSNAWDLENGNVWDTWNLENSNEPRASEVVSNWRPSLC